MLTLIVALKIAFAGLTGYGLMRLVLRRIETAGADLARQERIARGVGFAAGIGAIVGLLI